MADNDFYRFHRIIHIANGDIYNDYIYNANNVILVPGRNLYISDVYIFLPDGNIY